MFADRHTDSETLHTLIAVKGKQSVGPGADPDVQSIRLHLHLYSFHQMAPHGSTYLIPAHYSFIDPEKIKDRVGLAG